VDCSHAANRSSRPGSANNERDPGASRVRTFYTRSRRPVFDGPHAPPDQGPGLRPAAGAYTFGPAPTVTAPPGGAMAYTTSPEPLMTGSMEAYGHHKRPRRTGRLRDKRPPSRRLPEAYSEPPTRARARCARPPADPSPGGRTRVQAEPRRRDG